MATLDEISKEKQRVSEALARVDARRDKLAGQLGELEATGRVLARYSKGVRARKMASASTPPTMSAPLSPGTSGRAASKSATGSSTPRSRAGRSNARDLTPG
jgi:hypothetical protein